MPAPPLNANQVAAFIQQISSNTGAEVVFKSMTFEMHGLEHEVHAAVRMILELDLVKVTFIPPPKVTSLTDLAVVVLPP